MSADNTTTFAPNYCHALDAVCVMRAALLSHLKSGNYIFNALNDGTFPQKYRDTLEIISTEEKIPRNDALPRIALSLGEMTIAPFMPKAMTGGSSAVMMTGMVNITISTPVESMTEALRIECSFMLSANWSNFRGIGMYVKEVRSTTVRQDRDRHSNFYISTLAIPVDFEVPMWKSPSLTSMLREMSMVAVDTLTKTVVT